MNLFVLAFGLLGVAVSIIAIDLMRTIKQDLTYDIDYFTVFKRVEKNNED